MLDHSIKSSLQGRLDAFDHLINIAASKIEPQWLWQPLNDHIPCIGVQLQHLCGNLNQYVVFNLSGVEDSRNRPEEFKSNPGLGLNELMTQLHGVIEDARNAIDGAPSHPWNDLYHVQGFSMSRLEACIHGIEHLNYHLGQIALIIKHYRPQDLGFYPDISN